MDELPASFGKYFLTDKIASGGMADIYLAKLIGPGGFEKQLVIKQIRDTLSRHREFVDLLVTEAKTLVSLSHGNIVPIYELGVVDGVYFIAMEYIDGTTLAGLMGAAGDRALEPAMAGYIFGEILKGLDYAHRKGTGIVHRDLSPRNVMLSRDGEVKLVDFGIAVPAAAEPDTADNGDRTSSERHSQRQRVVAPVGSYPYMSPEQANGKALTAQSDLFSAGVLLWEMLTGARLFARDSAAETLAAVHHAEVPMPSHVRPGIPPALEELCLSALALQPADRCPSASRALAVLQRYLYTVDDPVTPAAVAQLVARRCPPVVRHPTRPWGSKETSEGTDDGGVDRGPETAPLPRAEAPEEGTVRLPRGKARARTTRYGAAAETSFATHVEIEHALAGEHTKPLVPAQAHDRGPVTPSAEPAAQTDAGANIKPVPDAAPMPNAASEAGVGGRRKALPWSRLTAGIVAVVAGLAVLLLWGLMPDTTPDTTTDTPPVLPAEDHAASPQQRGPAVADLSSGARTAARAMDRQILQPPSTEPVSPTSSGPGDAQATAAADGATTATATSPDAVSQPRHADPQAGAARAPSAPATETRTRKPIRQAVRQGTLKVGANPWADVYLDGRKLGRAPNAWKVPVGPHRVQVVFPVGERPVRRNFRVQVSADKVTSVGVVDFRAELTPPE